MKTDPIQEMERLLSLDDIEDLNRELESLVASAKEAHRLFRVQCYSTCAYELGRIKRKADRLASQIEDLKTG